MKLIIEQLTVYKFVKNISHDPNPIHLNENPIIPGDLLVSLYLAINGGVYADFYFLHAKKAPLEIEIREDGIYNQGKKFVDCNLYRNLSKEKIESTHTNHHYTNNTTKIKQFFNKHFNISISESLAQLIGVYAYFTKQISNYIEQIYEKVRLAVYTKHSFLPTPLDSSLLSIRYHHKTDKEKNRNIFQAYITYNSSLTISKEVLLKGKIKEK